MVKSTFLKKKVVLSYSLNFELVSALCWTKAFENGTFEHLVFIFLQWPSISLLGRLVIANIQLCIIIIRIINKTNKKYYQQLNWLCLNTFWFQYPFSWLVVNIKSYPKYSLINKVFFLCFLWKYIFWINCHLSFKNGSRTGG